MGSGFSRGRPAEGPPLPPYLTPELDELVAALGKVQLQFDRISIVTSRGIAQESMPVIETSPLRWVSSDCDGGLLFGNDTHKVVVQLRQDGIWWEFKKGYRLSLGVTLLARVAIEITTENLAEILRAFGDKCYPQADRGDFAIDVLLRCLHFCGLKDDAIQHMKIKNAPEESDDHDGLPPPPVHGLVSDAILSRGPPV
jgi:hypothetical protein